MKMDAFSVRLVQFVREMPDEALLELVKQKLGVTSLASLPSSHGEAELGSHEARRPLSSQESPVAQCLAASQGPSQRQRVLDEIERVVKASSGVSASEVAKVVGIPQTQAAAALRELKLAKRIYQGGDRRFARYGGDERTAEQSSLLARKTAKGPILRTS